MTIAELIRDAASRLQQAGCDAPRLDAELLLMRITGLSRTGLIVHATDAVAEKVLQQFEVLLARRLGREPLAYILGEREFWSRSFRVTPDVLIPRPETEHLIESVLRIFPEQQGEYLFADIGTGSGCIAVTLACEYPHAHVVATDISSVALAVAQSNAGHLGAAERIEFYQGDMLNALPEGAHFDAIISNPPYVADVEMAGLDAELAFEPVGALTDGGDGLRFLTEIIHGAVDHLNDAGYVVVETGSCGLPEVPSTMKMQQELVDLAGHLRGAIYQRQG